MSRSPSTTQSSLTPSAVASWFCARETGRQAWTALLASQPSEAPRTARGFSQSRLMNSSGSASARGRYPLAGTPVVTDPDDGVPRVLPPEIVPLAPAPDLAPVETLTSVDCPVGPERCTVPDSSRTVVRLLLAGIDLSC